MCFSPTVIFRTAINTRSFKLNSAVVSHSDIRKEGRKGKNDRSGAITMALINMQSAKPSCLNSTTLCVCVCMCETNRVGEGDGANIQ